VVFHEPAFPGCRNSPVRESATSAHRLAAISAAAKTRGPDLSGLTGRTRRNAMGNAPFPPLPTVIGARPPLPTPARPVVGNLNLYGRDSTARQRPSKGTRVAGSCPPVTPSALLKSLSRGTKKPRLMEPARALKAFLKGPIKPPFRTCVLRKAYRVGSPRRSVRASSRACA
jgi:hypothetical protein